MDGKFEDTTDFIIHVQRLKEPEDSGDDTDLNSVLYYSSCSFIVSNYSKN